MSGDSIRGVEPREVQSPGDSNELAEVIKKAARDQQCISVTGGGTKLGLGLRPERVDVLVRTRGMKRILEYAPADMVLIAEAGATLAEIQAVAREQRQQLALDPPFFAQATLGGIIATGDTGPRRLRYGAVKDLIIGATLIRADGTPAKSGGKVVKNVAGFDLPKLVCGSLGTLATLATATFRLHPLPELTSTVLVDAMPAAGVHALLLQAREAQLEPSAALALRSGTSWQLAVSFEGFAPGVREQCTRLAALARTTLLPDAEAAQLWSRHAKIREQGAVRIKITYPASRFAELERQLLSLGSDWAIYPTLGIGHLSASELVPGAVETVRAALVKLGGSLVIQQMPDAMPSASNARDAIDPWGAPPASIGLMRQLKNSFDPERRLNRGRYVGTL